AIKTDADCQCGLSGDCCFRLIKKRIERVFIIGVPVHASLSSSFIHILRPFRIGLVKLRANGKYSWKCYKAGIVCKSRPAAIALVKIPDIAVSQGVVQVAKIGENTR